MYYSISAAMNRKFFDIILVFNEYDILEKRMKLLENYIDRFVIYDFGVGCKNFSNSQTIHLKAPTSFLDEDFDLMYETVKLLDKNTLYIEDVFIFSKANEIPDLEKLMQEIGLIDIKPLILKQQKVFWQKNLKSVKTNFSSFALTYTQYILGKNLYEKLLNLKAPIPANHLTIDCGWQINGFQKTQDLVESIKFWKKSIVEESALINSMTQLKDFNNQTLVRCNTNLPQCFDSLAQNIKIREAKNLILTTDQDYYNNSTEDIILIDIGKIISNNFQHNFTIPTINYYESDNFALSYSKNETLKVLEKLGALEHDVITFHKKETLDKVSITYQEFSKFVPSELF
jgi:hypothetical protein